MKYGLATGGGRGLTALLAVGVLALVGGLAAISIRTSHGNRTPGFAAKRSRPRTPTNPRPGCSRRWRAWSSFAWPWRSFLKGSCGFSRASSTRSSASGAGRGFPGSGAARGGAVDARHHQRLHRDRARRNDGRHRRVDRGGGRRRKARPGAVDTSCRRSACNTPGRSFAEMMAEHLLPAFLRPRTTRQAPRGLFPSASDFGGDVLIRSATRCTSRSSGAGRSVFLGFAFSNRERSTSIWYTSCSWSCWPWRGCPSGGIGARHERMAGSLGNHRGRLERSAGPVARVASSMSGQWVTTVLAVLAAGPGPGGCRLVLDIRRQSADRAAVGHSRRRVQRGNGRSVGLLPCAGLSGLAAGKHLRAGLLEADRAPAERPEAAGFLRNADRRHGTAS